MWKPFEHFIQLLFNLCLMSVRHCSNESLEEIHQARTKNKNTNSLKIARKDRSKVDSFDDCQPSLSKLKSSKGVRSLQKTSVQRRCYCDLKAHKVTDQGKHTHQSEHS